MKWRESRKQKRIEGGGRSNFSLVTIKMVVGEGMEGVIAHCDR